MSKRAHVHGRIEYREGDGMNLTIPQGPVEITETTLDVTLSWVDGETHGSAAIPMADFKRHVANKAIEVLGPQPDPPAR